MIMDQCTFCRLLLDRTVPYFLNLVNYVSSFLRFSQVGSYPKKIFSILILLADLNLGAPLVPWVMIGLTLMGMVQKMNPGGGRSNMLRIMASILGKPQQRSKALGMVV